MNLAVAILAGGLSIRLRPITEEIPKSLVPVAGEPFVFHQLALLRRNGFRKVVFCIGYLGDQIQAAVGDGRQFGVEVSYAFDGEKLLGTGGGLKRAIPLLGETFFVLYGDSYLDCNYAAIEEAFIHSGRLGLMAVFHNRDRWDRSNVLFQRGEILAYEKRQRIPGMEHIDYGAGVLSAQAFAQYPDNEVFDLQVVYSDLLAQGQLVGFQVPNRFYEIGSPEGLAELDALLRAEQPERKR